MSFEVTPIHRVPISDPPKTMGLYRIISEIEGDFSWKTKIFLPRIFNAPLRGLPLEFCMPVGIKNRLWQYQMGGKIDDM